MKMIFYPFNLYPYKVWPAETPHGSFVRRGHLSRGFFNILKYKENENKKFSKHRKR